ncbi:hypothetical protein, variant [Spizellomyces punctatus DAOM BR117]|uniref:Uncharacterized protein n=1 Tax=Spizellomyces punctatus (strain DAOM BR117) TaxID=645134 RepID=A0A0L0H5W3_SPIPD|nr:hypothetical protein, variant [Spizellomyces punctatus DAOM BR117]KNC96088.1 hypothetical protein, variant [Spizellomyces punctatus DAOM BR117]|eukprot:XP_016604128.1 hypothetical protein, variant [Spizellomyces punctatus DAOM BR117]
MIIGGHRKRSTVPWIDKLLSTCLPHGTFPMRMGETVQSARLLALQQSYGLKEYVIQDLWSEWCSCGLCIVVYDKVPVIIQRIRTIYKHSTSFVFSALKIQKCSRRAFE